MTCEPVLVTSKVRVPAGASAAEILQSESDDSTLSARGLPPSAASVLGLSAFSVQAARKGAATTRAVKTRVLRMGI